MQKLFSSSTLPGISRLEAFSDSVIAVIITIIVLEMKVPAGADWAALRPVIPQFLAYVLSFTVIGIYWNNHHHLLRNAASVTPQIMWTNLLLLFFLSLLPFGTLWLGEHYTRVLPTVLYGADLLLCSLAFALLLRAIRIEHAANSKLIRMIGGDFKGKMSTLLYALAIPLAYVRPWLADGVFVLVALIWFIPDRRLAAAATRGANLQ